MGLTSVDTSALDVLPLLFESDSNDIAARALKSSRAPAGGITQQVRRLHFMTGDKNLILMSGPRP